MANILLVPHCCNTPRHFEHLTQRFASAIQQGRACFSTCIFKERLEAATCCGQKLQVKLHNFGASNADAKVRVVDAIHLLPKPPQTKMLGSPTSSKPGNFPNRWGHFSFICVPLLTLQLSGSAVSRSVVFPKHAGRPGGTERCSHEGRSPGSRSAALATGMRLATQLSCSEEEVPFLLWRMSRSATSTSC